MFKRIVTGVFLVVALGAAGLAFGQASPAAVGKTMRLGHVDAGTLPTPVIGGMAFDTVNQQLIYSDGGTWVYASSTASGSTANYSFATTSAAQTTNIGGNDHIKFDTLVQGAGSLITLDTTTTYTNNNAVASLGRWTLVGGHCYYASFTVGEVVFNNANSVAVFAWVNAENGALINPVGVAVSVTTGTTAQWNTSTQAILCPSADTRYEVRFTSAPTNLVQVGNQGTTVDGGAQRSWPSATIFALN